MRGRWRPRRGRRLQQRGLQRASSPRAAYDQPSPGPDARVRVHHVPVAAGEANRTAVAAAGPGTGGCAAGPGTGGCAAGPGTGGCAAGPGTGGCAAAGSLADARAMVDPPAFSAWTRGPVDPWGSSPRGQGRQRAAGARVHVHRAYGEGGRFQRAPTRSGPRTESCAAAPSPSSPPCAAAMRTPTPKHPLSRPPRRPTWLRVC